MTIKKVNGVSKKMLTEQDIITEIRNSEFETLTEKLIHKDNSSVLLVVHDGFDSDAGNSAFALQNFFSQLGVHADIVGVRGSEVNLQNRAINKTLGIEINGEDFFEKTKTKYNRTIYVDHTDRTTLKRVSLPDMILDHHKGIVQSEGCLVIREEIGATATIVYLLFKHSSFNVELSREVLIALAIAIYLDTKGLKENGVTNIDKSVFVEILLLILQTDPDYYLVFDNLCHFPPTSEAEIELFRIAFENKKYINDLVYVFLGETGPEHENLYGPIADKFLSLEKARVVVVVGVHDKKFLKGSVRVDSKAFQVEEILKEIFRVHYYTTESGASYDARTSSGGFIIPIGQINKYELRQEGKKNAVLLNIENTYFESCQKFNSGRTDDEL